MIIHGGTCHDEPPHITKTAIPSLASIRARARGDLISVSDPCVYIGEDSKRNKPVHCKPWKTLVPKCHFWPKAYPATPQKGPRMMIYAVGDSDSVQKLLQLGGPYVAFSSLRVAVPRFVIPGLRFADTGHWTVFQWWRRHSTKAGVILRRPGCGDRYSYHVGHMD